MKHLGDITKLHGNNVPLVDIVCGGSPCQDLSRAGKRAGLSGERSSLFLDQIRIIKEMRDECRKQQSITGITGFVYPRYMLWENVPGCFSSNSGDDFRCVLEETAKVSDEDAVIPGPPKGKWPPAGCIVADGWSIAWRVHDAQYWGNCAQRRKRICVLADFNGQSAWGLLFELQRKSVGDKNLQAVTGFREECGSQVQNISSGMQGDIKPGDQIGERASGDTMESSGESGSGRSVIGFNRERCGAAYMNDMMPTLQAAAGTSGNNKSMVCIEEPVLLSNNQKGAEVSQTGICNTLPAAMGMGGGYVPMITDTTVSGYTIVRRLTELECERLMVYPDHWTDIGDWVDSQGKRHKVTASMRYKALGNSICLPFWEWLAHRIVKFLRLTGKQDITMASLFDGIGGFPLVFSRAGCKPVWASEIEEFPIAVTKIRFPEEN